MAQLTARASLGSVFATVGAAANSVTALANGLGIAASRFNNYMSSEAKLQDIKAQYKLIQTTATIENRTAANIAEELASIKTQMDSSELSKACFAEATKYIKAELARQAKEATPED